MAHIGVVKLDEEPFKEVISSLVMYLVDLLPVWFSFLGSRGIGFVGQQLQQDHYVFMLLHLGNTFVVSAGPL